MNLVREFCKASFMTSFKESVGSSGSPIVYTSLHKGRLLKLATFLKTHEFTKEAGFDFCTYGQRTDCGTVACALGWCPAVFPDDWEAVTSLLIPAAGFFPRLKGVPAGEIYGDAHPNLFFGINDLESKHLFQPEKQLPEIFGGEYLLATATPLQVAANIEAFVELKGPL